MAKGCEWAIVLPNNANGLLVSFPDLYANFQQKFWREEDMETRRLSLESKNRVQPLLEQATSPANRRVKLTSIASLFTNSMQISEYFGSLEIGTFGPLSDHSDLLKRIHNWKSQLMGLSSISSYGAVLTVSDFLDLIEGAISNTSNSTDEASDLAVFKTLLKISQQTWRDLDKKSVDNIGTEFHSQHMSKSLDSFGTYWLNKKREEFLFKELKKIADDPRVTSFCASLSSSPTSTTLQPDSEYFVVTEK